MNRLYRLKPLWVFFAGAFFVLASLWLPHFQRAWERNIFLSVDSLVLLGATLLVSLLAYYLLPDFLVRTGASSSCRNRTKALGFGIGLLSLIGLTYVLYLVNQHILHSFLSSADEHSCYFLAECLRKGKLYVDIPPLVDFFRVVHVGMRDGKWFSVYPPGWPLVWALGLQLNIVDWLNPIMSSASIFFFYLAGIRLFSRQAVFIGLLICCLNPFFMFTAASYFSHGTCLLMISVFLYAFLRWHEAYLAGKDPVGWASLCAAAVGYGLMTRYLTMAAIVGPFLLYHYLPIFIEWRGWKKGKIPFKLKRPRFYRSDWLFLGIIVAFMVLILYQNYLVTGKPFRAPNKHDKSWERLGFRRDYTSKDAFLYLILRIFYLVDWFAPAIVATYLFSLFNSRRLGAFSTLGIERNKSILGQLFRLSVVFIAFAYFFYYSWGGNQWGPRYYWEGLPFLCVAVADWIVERWKNGSLRVRKFLFVFVIASIATSGVLFVKHMKFTEEASRQRRALYDFAEKNIKGKAVVFIHGFLGDRLVLAEEDAVRNSPFLDGRILYAHDLGERNGELMAGYSGREFYRGTYDRALLRARLEKMDH